MTRNKRLRERLVAHIQDAHAMEVNVTAMLTSMIASTGEPRMKRRLERHLEETRGHASALEGRLRDLGEGGSAVKTGAAVLGALPKGLLDQFRSEKPARNARDAFVTEALEIAAYELLERLAQRADDPKTAGVARRNREDEVRMSRYLARSWDRVVELTLEEEGIAA